MKKIVLIALGIVFVISMVIGWEVSGCMLRKSQTGRVTYCKEHKNHLVTEVKVADSSFLCNISYDNHPLSKPKTGDLVSVFEFSAGTVLVKIGTGGGSISETEARLILFLRKEFWIIVFAGFFAGCCIWFEDKNRQNPG